MYIKRIPKGARPSASIKNGVVYLYHLGIVCNVFEQFYVFWQKGWIDKETWRAWDRWLRELYLGQFPADTRGQGREQAYQGQDLDKEDKNFAENSLKLFDEFWNEIQNRRYYSKGFRSHLDSILAEAKQNLPSYLED